MLLFIIYSFNKININRIHDIMKVSDRSLLLSTILDIISKY
jgi:hypothetical protein